MYDIRIMKDERAFDIAAAWEIIGQILKKPDAVIGLSTGQTTKNMHAIVADIYRQYPFDTSRVTFFNVDELTNLPRTYPGCCWTMIEEQIAGPLGIPEERFIMPATMSDDFGEECRKFQAALEAKGGADLQMLGLGYNGHIGINQPGTPSAARPGCPPWIPFSRRECGGRPASGRIIRWAA